MSEPSSIRFLPLPYDALELFDGPELLLVVELYRRAHALRWRVFNVTERALCSRYRIGNRRLWACLEQLDALGLLTFERGGGRMPTRLLVVCPTREVEPDSKSSAAQQQRKRSTTAAQQQHNEQRSNAHGDEQSADPGSKASSANAAQQQRKRSTGRSTLTRQEIESRERGDPNRREAAPRSGGPKWLSTWLRSDGRTLLDATPRAALGALASCVNRIRPTDVEAANVVESAARPVLRLWRELVESGEARTLEALVDVVALLADACRLCPDELFARDVRGEGWDSGRNRSANVAAVCRLSPPSSSQGATWQERLEAARAWNKAGRPAVASRSTSTGGDGYLARLNQIAAEAP